MGFWSGDFYGFFGGKIWFLVNSMDFFGGGTWFLKVFFCWG